LCCRPTAVAALLRPYGITTGQVWQALREGGGANRRGDPEEVANSLAAQGITTCIQLQ